MAMFKSIKSFIVEAYTLVCLTTAPVPTAVSTPASTEVVAPTSAATPVVEKVFTPAPEPTASTSVLAPAPAPVATTALSIESTALLSEWSSNEWNNSLISVEIEAMAEAIVQEETPAPAPAPAPVVVVVVPAPIVPDTIATPQHTPYEASSEEREHIMDTMKRKTRDQSFDQYFDMYKQEVALYEERQEKIRVAKQLAIWEAQIAYDIATTPVPVPVPVPAVSLSQWEADSWQEAPISGVVEKDAMDLIQQEQEERHMSKLQEEAIKAAPSASFWDVLTCPLGQVKDTLQDWRVSQKLASSEAELAQWDQAMAKAS